MTGRGEMGEVHAPAHATHGSAGHAREAYRPVFVGERRKELDELLTRYPTKMAALLPALWMVQEDRGWVSDEGMAEVARELDLTPAYVKGVVTFYTMYHQHPVGRHFVQVCTTSPCNVCGAEEVVRAFLRHTGCEELGETSPEDWAGQIDQAVFRGRRGFAEIAFFHRATATLILADLIQALEPARLPLATRLFAHATGATLGETPAPMRWLLGGADRAANRAAAERLVAWKPQRVIFAHGTWFQDDAQARLERGLAWLLRGTA